jgi:hypothetical protein
MQKEDIVYILQTQNKLYIKFSELNIHLLVGSVFPKLNNDDDDDDDDDDDELSCFVYSECICN